jgi:hypothetical protein
VGKYDFFDKINYISIKKLARIRAFLLSNHVVIQKDCIAVYCTYSNMVSGKVMIGMPNLITFLIYVLSRYVYCTNVWKLSLELSQFEKLQVFPTG